MKTPSKKWIIIIGIGIILFAFGKYNEANAEKTKVEATQEPEVKLTYREEFDKKFMSGWDGSYRPVEKYLKANLNDPSSLEIVNTWNNGMNKDSTFSIKTVYRARNSFNALVKESIYCNVDINGKLSEIRSE